MANYSQLKAAIDAVIKTNGNQEITGAVLQTVLDNIVNVIGANYTFAGVATPSTNPGTPDQNVVYMASQAGTYTNFGNVTLKNGIHLFLWNGAWQIESVFVFDDDFYGEEITERDITPILGIWTAQDTNFATFTSSEGNNGVATMIKYGGAARRLYLDISELEDGKYYRLSFDCVSSTSEVFQAIGYTTAPNASWRNLLDINGQTFEGSSVNGIFEKQEGINYLVIGPSQYTIYPVSLTFSNFAIKEIVDVIDDLKNINDSNQKEILNIEGILGSVIDTVTWETNDSSVWNVDNSYEDFVVLENKIKTAQKYIGFNISNIPDGKYVRLRLCVDGPLVDSTQLCAFDDLAPQSWTGLPDINGTFPHKDSLGYITVTFLKTPTKNWIVIASNSFGSGVKLLISDVSLFYYDDIKKRVNNCLVTSSIIPPDYSWTKLMDIQGSGTSGSGQGSCVYEDTFINASAANSQGQLSLRFYNLNTKEFVQELVLTGITNTITHANTISFSGTKYDNADAFPLLYIPSGYVQEGTSEAQVYVYRITGAAGSYTASLIQTITLNGFGTWTEWICDADNNRAWIKTDDLKFRCYNIPSISDSTVIIDVTDETLDEFELLEPNFSFGVSKSSNQGFMYHRGRIWYSSGVPNYEGEGKDACYIGVINVRSRCRETVVWLADVGLTNGTSNVYEPEGIFIWRDKLYIPYRTFIAEIHKTDLV